MHLPHHQQMLRNAANHGGIAAATEIIRRECPDALHVESGNDETLSKRRFMVQPRSGVAHGGFVMTVEEARAALAQCTNSGASATSKSSEESDADCALAADAA